MSEFLNRVLFYTALVVALFVGYGILFAALLCLREEDTGPIALGLDGRG